jgi:DNA-binding HxlR family transcriptional regulator
MTAIKSTSTIQENKKNAFVACPVTFVMQKIGGYWKPIILFNLLAGAKRYSALKRAIPTISEKMLIQHLKQLEADGLVIRRSQNVVPPHVTYELSKEGRQMRKVLYAMAEWAVANGGTQSRLFGKQLKDFPAGAKEDN